MEPIAVHGAGALRAPRLRCFGRFSYWFIRNGCKQGLRKSKSRDMHLEFGVRCQLELRILATLDKTVFYAIFNTGTSYGNIATMSTERKITVQVPRDLLKKAQQASGAGITQTIRTGLQLVAASLTYARLRRLRGKVRFTRTWTELKADR